MKLIFTGTGGAFTMSNFNTSMVIQKNDRNLLVDCGTDIRRSLARSGLCARDIETIYITHEHSDHCGGLEWMGFASYFDPNSHKPILIAEEEVMMLLRNTLVGFRYIHGKDMRQLDFLTLSQYLFG